MNDDALPDDLAALARELDDLAATAFGAGGTDEAEADALPDLSGSDFRLLRLIGRGGMGAVYEAEQISLGRRVAVKVLPRSFGRDPERIARFVEEARLAARLHHPGIVPVFGAGEAGGLPYFAMELVEGETAATRAVSDTRAAVSLALQAADALDYAHRCGVRHGDVKPSNLLVSPDGRVRLADFGLATFFATTEPTESSPSDSSLVTRHSSLDFPGGTTRYLAPELRTSPSSLVTRHSSLVTLVGAGLANADQYALGVTLRELLPGAPDRELGAVIAKATAASPEDRYADMAAFADDLRRWLGGEPVRARPASAWRSIRLWARRHRALAATLAALLALVIAWTSALTADWARRRADAREAAREIAELADATRALGETLRARRAPDAALLARGDALGDTLLGRHPGADGAVSALLSWRRAKVRALRAAGDDKTAARELMRLGELSRLFFLHPGTPDAEREELIETQLSRLERVRSDRDLAHRAANELRWELDRYTGPRRDEFLSRLAAVDRE